MNISVYDNDESDYKNILQIKKTDWDLSCSFLSSNTGADRAILNKYLKPALYRAGLLLPENWKEVAERVSQIDDIIIGVDTNILYDTTISEHFFDSLYLINSKEYINTPNWILIVILDYQVFKI